jgi:hypothetical protein
MLRHINCKLLCYPYLGSTLWYKSTRWNPSIECYDITISDQRYVIPHLHLRLMLFYGYPFFMYSRSILWYLYYEIKPLILESLLWYPTKIVNLLRIQCFGITCGVVLPARQRVDSWAP